MVARILRGKDITGLLRYHEKAKSTTLYAQLINDAKPAEELSLQEKNEAFKAYLRLNPKIVKPTFHVSLNPDPADKLDDDQLVELGRAYLERMNYGNQPYLIYKHEDIGRVHLHLVSVSVQLNGKVISNSQERYRSEAIRKDLEVKYGLVRAGEKVKKGLNIFEPIDVAAIEYGKTDTKSAIATVVRSVLRDYRCATLAAYRALLCQYHVGVDEVKRTDGTGETIGLLYAVINDRGEKVSSRLKGSVIGHGAAYPELQSYFQASAAAISQGNLAARVKQNVEQVLAAYPYLTEIDLEDCLHQQGIRRIGVPGPKGKDQHSFFLDTQTRVVLPEEQVGTPSLLARHLAPATVSRQELAAADLVLRRLYRHWRKSDPAYYYESSLLRALPSRRQELEQALHTGPRPLTEAQARVVAAAFISRQQGRRSQVEATEQAYFERQARVFIRFIQRHPALTLKERLTFLYASRITLVQQPDALWVQAVQQPRLCFAMPVQSVSDLFQGQAPAEPLVAAPQEVPVLTRTDRQVVQLLAQAPADRDYGALRVLQEPERLLRLPVLAYTTAEDRHNLFRHANLAAAQRGLRGRPAGELPHQLVFGLWEQGLLLRAAPGPAGLQYYLGYYRLPASTYVAVGPRLSGALQAAGYGEQAAAAIRQLIFRPCTGGQTVISPRYQLLVYLNQALGAPDPNSAMRVLKWVEQRNEALAGFIRKEWDNYVKQEKELSPDPARLLHLMRATIAAYPGDSLRPPGIADRQEAVYTPAAHQGATSLESISGLLANFSHLVFGPAGTAPAETYRPDKKRRKRRRPRF